MLVFPLISLSHTRILPGDHAVNQLLKAALDSSDAQKVYPASARPIRGASVLNPCLLIILPCGKQAR